MKKGFISKSYALTVIFSLLLSIPIAARVQAEVAGPGWFMGTAEPVSHEEAEAYYTEQAKASPLGIEALVSASAATTVTPEIQELARGLKYDPKLIYDYVHNHIDYVPYFGSLKGATLTYLDGSGNDFDQASLMIVLLRESSTYNPNIGAVQYVYGKMTIPGSQLANWLGVDQRWETIGTVLPSGGIPIENLYFDGTATVTRVWVKAAINGVDYLFDPAFKSYQDFSKIDIGQAANYSQSELLSAAQSGATVGADYVQNLNEGGIGSKLAEYSSNLINTIKSQYPNKEVKEIISGRSIIQTNLTDYQTTLPFPVVGTPTTWTDIPADKTTKLILRHGDVSRQNNFCKITSPDLTSVDINQEFYTYDITGKRLTFTHSGNIPEIRLDGSLVVSGNSTTTDKTLCIFIDHPYAAPCDANGQNCQGTYADQFSAYTVKNTGTYAIVSNFGGVSDMLLQKRQKQLDVYLSQGLSQTSESVLGETLNIMGITWLKELQMSKNLLSSLAETVSISHHDIGLMAQETGYYIDVKTSIISIISKHNTDADRQAHFKTMGLIGSAFEHGILEQLMGSDNPGVSTMKLFKIANSNPTNNKIFYADSTNFSIRSNIKSQLVNYSSSDLTNFQNLVNNGYSLIVPQDGQLRLNNWQGKGYIAKKFSGTSMSMQMAIGGGYLGGYNSTTGNVNTTTVANNTTVNQLNNYNTTTVYNQVSPLPDVTSCKPVDMAGGAEVYESTDLVLGGNAPLGLAFSRSYNSSLNLEKRTMGYGWTHNYDIYLSMTSHGEPVLGRRQPVDAASMITALYAMLDLLKTQDNIVGWMTTSLSSKWAVDQTINNAVTVHLGNKVMEFIKLPDGTYSAPPGITTQLIKNGDNTYTLKERFGTQIDFNTSNKVSQLRDVDGNTMTFTYEGDNLKTVKDAFNRTLTFTYTNNLITSVSDSTDRMVSYGYDAVTSDLITYTDPELKPWTYVYDDPNHPHRMTKLINPLTVTTATLTYDSLGRVKTQTFPRQSGGTATHNFYFSGFRNAEEDPDNKTLIYYFDNSGRLVKFTNALEYSTQYEYDGQNHQTKLTNPRNYFTTFQYDGNHNLTKVINALTKETNNTYDAQFRLTDTIDPMYHGSRIDYDSEHHPTASKYGVLYNTSFLPLDNGLSQTSASYYANGFTNTATDGRSTVTTLTYDSYGNPQTAKTAAHPVVTTNYNTRGWLTNLTDQVNATKPVRLTSTTTEVSSSSKQTRF